jgi:HEAT repeat protein
MPKQDDKASQYESSLKNLSGEGLSREIKKRLADLHKLDNFVLELVTLGDKPVQALGEYLAGSPEAIPQSRVGAVSALAAIGTPSALEQLKKALFNYELKDLPPILAQSEYVVKNTIVEEFLRKQSVSPACDFLDVFRRYRLPASMRAIVKYRILEGVPLLVKALEDDVLATRAAEALQQFGSEAITAIMQELTISRLLESALTSRVSRQKQILAAGVLGSIGDPIAKPMLAQLANSDDPNIAASAIAAFIKFDNARISLEEATVLLKGALSYEWMVRGICREAATQIGDIGSQAALSLINLKSFPDLYGNFHDITEPIKSWLVAYIIENARSESLIEKLSTQCPIGLLRMGIWHVESEKALTNLLLLTRHSEPVIRRVVAHVLGRKPNEKALQTLVFFLGDFNREMVKEAREALLRFPREALLQVLKNEIPSIKPYWKRLLIRSRLIKILSL